MSSDFLFVKDPRTKLDSTFVSNIKTNLDSPNLANILESAIIDIDVYDVEMFFRETFQRGIFFQRNPQRNAKIEKYIWRDCRKCRNKIYRND